MTRAISFALILIQAIFLGGTAWASCVIYNAQGQPVGTADGTTVYQGSTFAGTLRSAGVNTTLIELDGQVVGSVAGALIYSCARPSQCPVAIGSIDGDVVSKGSIAGWDMSDVGQGRGCGSHQLAGAAVLLGLVPVPHRRAVPETRVDPEQLAAAKSSLVEGIRQFDEFYFGVDGILTDMEEGRVGGTEFKENVEGFEDLANEFSTALGELANLANSLKQEGMDVFAEQEKVLERVNRLRDLFARMDALRARGAEVESESSGKTGGDSQGAGPTTNEDTVPVAELPPEIQVPPERDPAALASAPVPVKRPFSPPSIGGVLLGAAGGGLLVRGSMLRQDLKETIESGDHGSDGAWSEEVLTLKRKTNVSIAGGWLIGFSGVGMVVMTSRGTTQTSQGLSLGWTGQW